MTSNPPTDRRERYAEALYATLEVSPTLHPWETLSPFRRAVWYARAAAAMAVADEEAAASAVFPEPPSRAAVLREAAAALDAHLAEFFREWPDEPTNSPWACGWKDAVAELRRVADEEQPAEAQQQPETEAPWVVQKICCDHDDGTAEFATWEAADSFREVYIDSARIADHERSAVIRRADAPAPVEPAAADSEETR